MMTVFDPAAALRPKTASLQASTSSRQPTRIRTPRSSRYLLTADQGVPSAPTAQHKITAPVTDGTDWKGILVGHRGSSLKAMERRTGAKIAIRGRGSTNEPSHDSPGAGDMNVFIEGTAEAVCLATDEINKVFTDPHKVADDISWGLENLCLDAGDFMNSDVDVDMVDVPDGVETLAELAELGIAAEAAVNANGVSMCDFLLEVLSMDPESHANAAPVCSGDEIELGAVSMSWVFPSWKEW